VPPFLSWLGPASWRCVCTPSVYPNRYCHAIRRQNNIGLLHLYIKMYVCTFACLYTTANVCTFASLYTTANVHVCIHTSTCTVMHSPTHKMAAEQGILMGGSWEGEAKANASDACWPCQRVGQWPYYGDYVTSCLPKSKSRLIESCFPTARVTAHK